MLKQKLNRVCDQEAAACDNCNDTGLTKHGRSSRSPSNSLGGEKRRKRNTGTHELLNHDRRVCAEFAKKWHVFEALSRTSASTLCFEDDCFRYSGTGPFGKG